MLEIEHEFDFRKRLLVFIMVQVVFSESNAIAFVEHLVPQFSGLRDSGTELLVALFVPDKSLGKLWGPKWFFWNPVNFFNWLFRLRLRRI